MAWFMSGTRQKRDMLLNRSAPSLFGEVNLFDPGFATATFRDENSVTLSSRYATVAPFMATIRDRSKMFPACGGDARRLRRRVPPVNSLIGQSGEQRDLRARLARGCPGWRSTGYRRPVFGAIAASARNRARI